MTTTPTTTPTATTTITTTTPTTTPETTIATTPTITTSEPIGIDISTVAGNSTGLADLIDVSASTVTEGISNADCWFHVRAFQEVMFQVHDQLGLPWWAALTVTVLGLRVAIAPLMLLQYKNTIRMANMQPHLAALNKAMMEDPAARSGDKEVIASHRARIAALMAKYKCNPLYSILPLLAIMPVFITSFFALRDFHLYRPSYAVEGTLWFTNLAARDPAYLDLVYITIPYGLPVIAAFIQLAAFRFGADGASMSDTNLVMRRVMIGATLMAPLFTQYFGSGLLIYFALSSFSSLAQTMLWRTKLGARLFNVPVKEVQPVVAVPTLMAKETNPMFKLLDYIAVGKKERLQAQAQQHQAKAKAETIAPKFSRSPVVGRLRPDKKN